MEQPIIETDLLAATWRNIRLSRLSKIYEVAPTYAQRQIKIRATLGGSDEAEDRKGHKTNIERPL